MAKINISLPNDQLDYIEEIAEESEVSRSEVFQWIITALMEDEELEDAVFPEELTEEEIEELVEQGIISEEDAEDLLSEDQEEEED